MVAVRMVQVTIDEVVGVIAVRDGRVPAIRAVLVGFVVLSATMRGSACRRIGGGYV